MLVNRLVLLAIILELIIKQQIVAYAHTYNCQFDKLYSNIDRTPKPTDKPHQLLFNNNQQYQSRRRVLQVAGQSKIRITLDFTDFNSIKATSHGQNTTTLSNLAFLRRSMLVVQSFYQSRIKVTPIARVYPPLMCHDIAVSSNDNTYGIASSDLHIYLRYLTDNTITYGATGISCSSITSIANYPDNTFQKNRPIVGRIIFNTYSIVDGQTLTNRLFASITATALHETIHILGFDSSMYNFFMDPATAKPYNYTIIQNVNLNAGRNNNNILKTPFVTQWAKDFYNCPSITGMALENEEVAGGSMGSHWERLSMYDQLMTATTLGAQKGFSGLTFALLKDMGWYTVDDSFNDTTNYGYHLGCGFYNAACYDNVTYPQYFCDPTAYSGVTTCATNFIGKAICTNQTAAMTDRCGIYGSYFNCVDPTQADDGYKSYTFQTYGTTSFCVESTFANVGIQSTYRGRCYNYKCFSNRVEFYVRTYTITCMSNENSSTQKTINTLNGYLACPNFNDFCTNSRKICPNWCSQNGFCTRGICNCLPGYFGADCSVTSCTSAQYFDTTTNLCVNACPSGTYSNIYSRSCMPCAATCSQCRDEPTICISCVSSPTNRKYFWVANSTCVSVCPTDTYTDGDYCRDCDATVSKCGSCDYSDTNCTSCLGGLFLQAPNFGSCGPTCTGTYSLYDVVNYKCVSTCINNLIYYAGSCTLCPNPTDGNCDLCANGTYKYIGDQLCHGSCPSGYFADIPTRFCKSCDITCKQCVGSYPQNCTSCYSTSVNKYLLLSSICVSGCPLGFYTDDNYGTCTLCDPNLNCATCSITTNATIICLSCKYQFFLQANGTCLSSCDFGLFQNTWNRTCDLCSLMCGNCTSPTSDACSDCRSGKVFLGNSTGRYCLNSCPVNYYYQSGTNCLNCYSTCLTCNGSNSDNCLTCITGLYLSNGMCRYVCPANYYPRSTTARCERCDLNCNFCFGPTVDNCTACVSGFVLNNFTCTTSCPQGMPVNQWGVCYSIWMATCLCLNFITLLILF